MLNGGGSSDPNAAAGDYITDARNGGAGDYGNAGATLATLTIARHGGANAEDTFGFDTSGTSFHITNGNHLGFTPSLVYFATFANSNGTLTINFTSSTTTATTALVNEILQHITYSNSSDTPPASVTLDYTFNDGSPGGGQGSGASATATGSTVVNITAANDDPTGTPTAVLADGTEDTPYTVSAADLLAGFSDVDGGALSVVNLGASDGAVVDNLDGTFTITPTLNFNGLVTLTYDVSDGNGGSVTGVQQSYNLVAVDDAPTVTGPVSGSAAASPSSATR